MNINDVIALSKAGFNSEQIAQMALVEQQQPAPDPAAEPAPASTPSLAAAPAPVAAPALVPAQSPAPDNKASFDAIMAAIGGLKLQLQQTAIQTAQQPAQQQPSADDMIAAIINPPAAVNDK